MTIKKNRNRKLDGKIVKVIDGVKNASTGQSVIINLGKKDGLNVGNLLSVVEKKPIKRAIQLYENDTFDKSDSNNEKQVLLPDEKIAKILVYNTYNKVSLALITEAEKTVSIIIQL